MLYRLFHHPVCVCVCLMPPTRFSLRRLFNSSNLAITTHNTFPAPPTHPGLLSPTHPGLPLPPRPAKLLYLHWLVHYYNCKSTSIYAHCNNLYRPALSIHFSIVCKSMNNYKHVLFTSLWMVIDTLSFILTAICFDKLTAEQWLGLHDLMS